MFISVYCSLVHVLVCMFCVLVCVAVYVFVRVLLCVGKYVYVSVCVL